MQAYSFIIDEVVKADRELTKTRENRKLKEISHKRMGGAEASAVGAAAEGDVEG